MPEEKIERLKVVHPGDDEKLAAELDKDEEALREIRVDLPGYSTTTDGVLVIAVGKAPKDEYFRVHPSPDYCLPTYMVTHVQGFDTTWCVVTPGMVELLRSIKIFPALHRIYFITSEVDAWRLVPVRQARADGAQNIWNSTLEVALQRAKTEWVRLYNEQDQRSSSEGWKVFPADPGRFPDPVWPDMSMAKLIRLGFTDRGNNINGPDHPLVKKWSGRV
jgi:hypothetical protein